jgi:hypothetical protein
MILESSKVQVQTKKRSKGRAPVVTAAAAPSGRGKSGSTRAQAKTRGRNWHIPATVRASSEDGSEEYSDLAIGDASGDEDPGLD